MVDEPRVLVAESIVILPPNMGAQEVVKRANRPPPGNVVANLQPLRMLIEHRIDDVNERLVTRKKSVTAGQQIPSQPALALVFAEHLHHPTIRREVVVVGIAVSHPC